MLTETNPLLIVGGVNPYGNYGLVEGTGRGDQ